MSKPVIDINEADLHAYVDHQLSEERKKAVEELILSDPEVAKQINLWRQQNIAIARYFEKESFTDIPENLNLDKLKEKNHKETSEAYKPQKPRWYYSMTASILLMITSGLIGWFAHDLLQPAQQNSSNFVNLAISAYEVFSVEALHPIEVGADKKEHLVKWLSKRINHQIQLPELDRYGFELLGGRLLSMQEGRPAAQFMFENDQGQRITWLVSKSPVYKDHDFIFENKKTINAFYWMDSEVAYSVSGEINRKNLYQLSEGIYQQINTKKVGQLAAL